MTNLPTQVNSDLYNSVYSANEAIKQIYDLKNQEDTLRNEAQQLRTTAQRKRASCRKKHIWMPFAFWYPAGVVIMLICFAIIGAADAMGLTGVVDLFLKMTGNGSIILVFLVVSWLAVFGITFIFPCKDKKLLAEADIKEQLADTKRQDINKLVAKSAKELSVLAPKYRYPTASEFVVELFDLGRASTLPEAYDKLEEQLHRWRMEESMSSMISLQMTHLEFLGRIEFNTFWS